ncbi:DUF3556 domain-containing protein [Pseudonocardia sp. ICBG1293]|uniref:DUF3556 domain-containing protein n=1 Tax=Pseudonocardia sp. ICBG1293 TaxID=2844382 RepID=UPI0021065CF2|nr:DUF3556 domain-containing protein [Pseudonocardia sp. ICBG1293]
MAATLTTSCDLPTEQLTRLYDQRTAILMAEKVQTWRSMHSHGRAHNGLVDRVVGEDPDVVVIDGEIVAGFAIGWNFGEGHLHGDQLLAAIQEQCRFGPGEVRIITLEGQPIQRQDQHYEIHDAALGLLESGTVTVREMRERQPWNEDGENYPVHDVVRTEAGLAALGGPGRWSAGSRHGWGGATRHPAHPSSHARTVRPREEHRMTGARGTRGSADHPDRAPTRPRPAARTSSVPVMVRPTTPLLVHPPPHAPVVGSRARGPEPDARLTPDA